MSGRRARQIRKFISREGVAGLRVKSQERRLRRAYNRASKIDRAAMRGQME